MTNSIFQLARQRAEKLPYAGAVTPHEAFQLLEQNPAILLIDVRTQAELDWVGKVAIRPEQFCPIQWNLYPTRTNPDFLTDLNTITDKQTILLFLCRSGVRSRAAAQLATEHGFTECFDILEGFEGDKDQDGHRKNRNGWCHAKLPWIGA